MIIKHFLSILLIVGACFSSSDISDFHKGRVQKFLDDFELCQTEIEPLRGGMSTSIIYKVGSYVIRLFPQGVSKELRCGELVVHKFCESKGFAPKITHIDDEEDPFMIVMEYIDGRNFDPKLDSYDINILRQIATDLQIIHDSTLNPTGNQTLVEQIEGFRHDAKRLPSSFEKWRGNLLSESKKYSQTKMAPVHGDLSRWNIIISKTENKVYFIDFQESRMDSIYSELGYFFYESGIDDPKVKEIFLETYLRRQPTSYDLDAVDFYMKSTAFACGIYLIGWIDQQYETKDLDEIIKNCHQKGIDFFKGPHHDKSTLSKMTSEDRTKLVLSHFKDC